MNLKILYEDNHIIAVVKPAGVLSQGDKTKDANVLDEVKKYLKEKYQKPGNVFVGLVHRLDRPVSGIMLFAKTSKGANRLSEQFRDHTVEKIYQAIVKGKPGHNKGVLVNNLKKDGRRASILSGDGKEAVLEYEVLKNNGVYSLLKIRLGTGRFHQIRAQFSVAGFPIIGDVKYEGPKWHDEKSIALCATGLSFYPATIQGRVNLFIEIPKEWQPYLSTGKP